jgi:hypothetical protein
MKRFFSMALLALPLVLAPSVGFANPLSVGIENSEPNGEGTVTDFFEDLRGVRQDFQALELALQERNFAAVQAARQQLNADLVDLFGFEPASPGV